jgi:hypothetical protein
LRDAIRTAEQAYMAEPRDEDYCGRCEVAVWDAMTAVGWTNDTAEEMDAVIAYAESVRAERTVSCS